MKCGSACVCVCVYVCVCVCGVCVCMCVCVCVCVPPMHSVFLLMSCYHHRDLTAVCRCSSGRPVKSARSFSCWRIYAGWEGRGGGGQFNCFSRRHWCGAFNPLIARFSKLPFVQVTPGSKSTGIAKHRSCPSTKRVSGNSSCIAQLLPAPRVVTLDVLCRHSLIEGARANLWLYNNNNNNLQKLQ